jgi:divalent metal cation (Fe/Co/Zn/Cd) transporter
MDASMSGHERLTEIAQMVPGVIDANVKHRQVAGRTLVEATVAVGPTLTASGASHVAHLVEMALLGTGRATWAHVHVDVAGYTGPGASGVPGPEQLEGLVRDLVLSVPQIQEVTDVMLYYGNVGQRSGLRVNVTLNIVLPLQYRLETARRVGAFATRRIKALPYVDYVDIDVELPDNDMELDSQLKPMVPGSFSGLLSKLTTPATAYHPAINAESSMETMSLLGGTWKFNRWSAGGGAPPGSQT